MATLSKKGKAAEQEVERETKQKHHWVSTAVPGDCEVCEGGGHCTTDPEMDDDGGDGEEEELTCCWCHLTVHRGCRRRMGETCDFGEFRRLIVPPGCVRARQEEDDDLVGKVVRLYPRNRRKWLISGVSAPQIAKESRDGWWTPLVVIGNTRAGNNDGAAYLNAFRSILNAAQVNNNDTAYLLQKLQSQLTYFRWWT